MLIPTIITNFQQNRALTSEEINCLINEFHISELSPHIEWVVKILAEYIVTAYIMQDDTSDIARIISKIDANEKGLILEYAVAFDWHPVARSLCSEEQFLTLCESLGLNQIKNERILPSPPPFTLLGLLNGMDVPSIDSPIVHVWIYKNPDNDEIESVLAVGKGIGNTRECFLEIACTTALAICAAGCSIVTDGFVYLRRTDIVEQGLPPQQQALQLDIPNALWFFVKTIENIAAKSKMIRIFNINSKVLTTFEKKIRELRSKSSPCLLTNNTNNVGLCVPISSKNSLVLPLSILHSSSYISMMEPFKKGLVFELKSGVTRRLRFHEKQLSEDWTKLNDYQSSIEIFSQEVINCYKQALPNNLPRPVQPFIRITNIENVPKITFQFQEFLRYFQALQEYLQNHSTMQTSTKPASDALKKVQELEQEQIAINAKVDCDACRLIHLREREFIAGFEYYTQNIPSLIRKHINWCEHLKKLLNDITIAERSPRMEEWLASWILNLVLRQQPLLIGKKTLPEFDIWSKKVWPLLFFKWKQATKDWVPFQTTSVFFHASYKYRRNEVIGIEIIPWYFFHSLSAFLFLDNKNNFRLQDILSSYSSSLAVIPSISEQKDIVFALQKKDIESLSQKICQFPKEIILKLGTQLQENAEHNPNQISLENVQKFDALFLLEKIDNFQACYAHPVAFLLLSMAVNNGLRDKPPYNQPNNQLPEIIFLFLNHLALCGMLATQTPGSTQNILSQWINFSYQTNCFSITPGGIGRSLNGLKDVKTLEEWVQKCLNLDKKWSENNNNLFLYSCLMTRIAGSKKRIDIYKKINDPQQKEYTQFREAMVEKIVKPLLPSFQKLRDVSSRLTNGDEVTALSILQDIIQPMAILMREFGEKQEQNFAAILDLLVGAEHTIEKRIR